MLHKTRGIVLNYIKYRETSIIAKIYTEEFGLQSYVENGVRSPKSKGRIALFQPLNLVDLVVYFKPQADIQRISEIKCTHPFFNIPTDIRKTTLGIFVGEILVLTLKENAGNPLLFSFLQEALIHLEHQDEGVENFHLYFLMTLSAYLGFGPHTAQDIRMALAENGIPLTRSALQTLQRILENPFGHPLNISKTQRMEALDHLLAFYSYNLDSFHGVRSLQILKDVLEA
ncbi:DNA repair protein RecO [Leadbetterella byssophila]|uniref:DNA repair protein RecO n=1 Tax=Leadbetterella byssophila TaxID=316068 RepID=UPI0039A1ECB0